MRSFIVLTVLALTSGVSEARPRLLARVREVVQARVAQRAEVRAKRTVARLGFVPPVAVAAFQPPMAMTNGTVVRSFSPPPVSTPMRIVPRLTSPSTCRTYTDPLTRRTYQVCPNP